MTGRDLRYVVNDDLSAYSITSVFKEGGVRPPIKGRPPASAPIAVSPDGKMVAGVLYDSSTEPSVKYYLPRYKLNKVSELYTTALKWRKPEDPAGDSVASLTIEVCAEVPNAPGFNLREIEHSAVVRLGFRLPVGENSPAGTPVESVADAASGDFVIWKEAGSLETISPGVRRVRMDIHTKEDFDRIYQCMTDNRFAARLEIQCFATIGYRTWKQVFLGPVFSPLEGIKTAPSPATPVTPVIQTAPTRFGGSRLTTATTKPALASSQMFTAVKLNPTLVTPLRPAPAPSVLEPVIATPVKTSPLLVRIADSGTLLTGKPTLTHANPIGEMFKVTDMRVKVGGIERAGVPVGIVVDREGVPVLLRTSVEARQQIPFYFVKETNGYMFDSPESPSSNHFLYRHQIDTDGGQAIFYQDMGARDQFYYEPQEFRLARSSANPHLPDLRVYLSTVVTGDSAVAAAGADDPSYRANLVYDAVPFIDPGILSLARTSLGADQSARFSPITAEKSQLVMDFPESVSDARPEVEISFDRAFSDSVDLPSSAFEEVFVWFRSGQGVKGAVEFTAPDGKVRHIPVKLSLQENTGALFNVQRPVALPSPTEFGVTLTNRIESTVVIERLHDVQLAPGVTAVPIRPAPGINIEPGASLQIDYRVSPAEAVVTEIRPVLATTIKPNHDLLWRQLFVNRGYTKQTFDIAVSVPQEYFDSPPPEGMEALTAVQIDFEPDTRLVLTREKLSATISLRIPLLDYLMAAQSAKRYRYKISTLHGSTLKAGKTSQELAGEGEVPLIIDLSQV